MPRHHKKSTATQAQPEVADYVRNPLTQNWILVDGPTYTKLILTGQVSRSNLRRLPRTSRPVPQARDYPRLNHRQAEQHLAEMAQLPLNPRSHTKPGRGGKTRGWGKVKPSRGTARRELYEQCGRRCFFKPNETTPGQSGYPICPKLSGKHPNCQLDCRGIQTARQYAIRFDPQMAQQIYQVQQGTQCR